MPLNNTEAGITVWLEGTASGPASDLVYPGVKENT